MKYHWRNVEDVWYTKLGEGRYCFEYGDNRTVNNDSGLFDDLENMSNGYRSQYYVDPIERVKEIVNQQI